MRLCVDNDNGNSNVSIVVTSNDNNDGGDLKMCPEFKDATLLGNLKDHDFQLSRPSKLKQGYNLFSYF